jgi:hypothetical protein
MRRAALTVAGATLLWALATATPSARASGAPAVASIAQPSQVTLYLFPADADHFPRHPAPWSPGRTVSYWGKFTDQSPSMTTRPVIGSYRATCMWLAEPFWPSSQDHKQDKRLSCTIVLAFKAPSSPQWTPAAELDAFVLQGLVRRPRLDNELFGTRYLRDLVVVGGTGKYKGAQGYADIKTAWKISVHYGLPPG